MASTMVAKEKQVLWKKQVQSIAADLQKMDLSDLFHDVHREVGNGYCVEFYSELGCLWNDSWQAQI